VQGEQGGDVVRGLSSLIIANGLLATLAFAKEKKKGYQTFMEEIGRFLSSQGDDGRHLFSQQINTLDDFIDRLTNNDSLTLQRAADESLAYLAYLKRFRTI
jgi:CRISPR/Cas system CMR-associated protein Cmr5 small subunit